MKNNLPEELKRFLKASKDGDFGFTLSEEGLSPDDAEIIRTLNEITLNYKTALEYELMKYKLTGEALGIGLWDMDFVSNDPADPNNRLVWSQEVRHLAGYTDENDFPNKLSSLTDKIHPEDREDALKVFASHVNDKTGQSIFDVEYRIKLKSGEYRRFRSFGNTLRDAEGNPLRVAGAIQDVEDKRRLQETLRKAGQEKAALANLENIMNGLSAMICVTDPKTDELLFINNSMKKAFNVDDSCIGKKCYKALHDFDDRCEFCPCNKLDENPDDQYVWEHTKEGDEGPRVFRYVSRYVNWPDGKKVHIQNAIDITDLKKAERDIAEKNEYSKILFENAPVGLTIFDENFGFIDCNENILKIFGGITREEYKAHFGTPGHSPEFQPDGSNSYESAIKIIRRVIIDGEAFKTDFVHRKPSGELLPVELTFARIKQGDRYVGLAYIYDMSEQTRLKEQLENALKDAENANKAKSDFLARMSHEIRTPMNAILGVTEIQMGQGNLSEDTEEALGKIYESGNLLMSIINDILDLSKIEADKLEIIPVEYNLLSLVNDTAQLNRMKCNSELIEFDVTLDENTPQNLIGDELRIKQILNNILSNAFKYTDKGYVEFRIYSEPAGGDGEVMLVFSVRDTGQGMTKEQLNMLFTDYMRFNIEANRTMTGTGLGLSITRRLVDMMGGEVTVDSEPGSGSTFTVRLPQKRIGDAVCGKELIERLKSVRFRSTALAQKAQFVREFMPYGSVLVVDDVESNQYVAKGLLLPYGLSVDIASSGFEVIEKVKRGKVYDIIFMDHMMPKMDGVEATKIIRDMGYAAPIIALTANAVIGQAEMFLSNGFDGFVSKPIDSRELNHVLIEFVRNRKPADVVEAARAEQSARGSSAALKKRKNIDLAAAAHESILKSPEMRKFIARDAQRAIEKLDSLYPRICSFGTASGIIDEGVIDDYVITVHGMKSALASIGEADMSAVSQRLELAGKDVNLSIMIEETPDFIAALRELADKCNAPAEPENTQGAAQQPIAKTDTGYLRESLVKIKAACEDYDVNAVRDLLGGLLGMTWDNDTADALDELNVHLLHSDFESAARKAGELAERL